MSYKSRDVINEGAKASGVFIASVIAIFLVAILIASMQIFGWGFFQRSTADFRGKTGQIEQTKANPDYRIAAYDHFYDLCGSIQAEEDQIGNIQKRPASGTTAGGFTQQQKDSILLAHQNSRAELIRQYNADARKADTLAHFRASDLPYQIEIDNEETTCSAF
ncbi:MAG: hypothetical protein AAB395_00385 [Patescibacteria group bacterium]